MAKKPFARLRKIFNTSVISGAALFMGHNAFAEEAKDDTPPVTLVQTAALDPQLLVEESVNPPAPAALPEEVKDVMYHKPFNTTPRRDTRRLDEREEDMFSRKYSVRATRNSLWIGTPERFDIPLLPIPDGGFINITQEYIQIKPMEKEWYGLASGIEYNVEATLGDGGVTIRGSEWDFRTGLHLGQYDSPKRGEFDHNSRTRFYVEGAHSMTFGDTTAANLVAGVSFNRVSGPDVVSAEGTRVYAQLDFPALFSEAINPANPYSLGDYSATVQAYAGTDTSGVKLGIYFNDFKESGNGLNFSAGPEIRYDQREGTSFHFKFRVSPKLW